jgi:hypothetical protein
LVERFQIVRVSVLSGSPKERSVTSIACAALLDAPEPLAPPTRRSWRRHLRRRASGRSARSIAGSASPPQRCAMAHARQSGRNGDLLPGAVRRDLRGGDRAWTQNRTPETARRNRNLSPHPSSRSTRASCSPGWARDRSLQGAMEPPLQRGLPLRAAAEGDKAADVQALRMRAIEALGDKTYRKP